MKRELPLQLIVVALCATSCATSATKMANLTRGMTKEEVKQLLGDPVDVRGTVDVKLFRYELATERNIGRCIVQTIFTLGLGIFDCKSTTSDYFVKLENDRVVEFGKGIIDEPGSLNRPNYPGRYY